MIKSYIICFFLFCAIGFSQTGTTKKYSKIKFVYEQKSNFLIQDGNLYADTLLLATTFPELHFAKTKSPVDSSKTIGSVSMESLNEKQKNLLYSYLCHSTHTIEGCYYIEQNKTRLLYTRGSKELEDNYKKYFNWEYYYGKFLFEKIIKYNKNKVYLNYPRVNYIASIDSQTKDLKFITPNQITGTYTFQKDNLIYTNLVTLNKNYTNHITTDVIFSNNEYGVDSIVSLYDTTKLISVTYE